MPYILQITLIGLATGILGTCFGGFIAVILGKPRDEVLSFLLAFSGGIMLSVVFVDLIPEAVEFGGILPSLFGVFVGALFLAVIDRHLPHSHFSGLTNGSREAHFVRCGILVGLGIAMHNLPEGLAIGAGYLASEQLGLGLAFIIAMQNIPEGVAMAGPFKASQISNASILFWTGLAGVPMGIGAFAGALMGGVSSLVLSLALGFAAGSMLYIIFDELIPDSLELVSGHAATFGALLGAALGLLILLNVH